MVSWTGFVAVFDISKEPFDLCSPFICYSEQTVETIWSLLAMFFYTFWEEGYAATVYVRKIFCSVRLVNLVIFSFDTILKVVWCFNLKIWLVGHSRSDNWFLNLAFHGRVWKLQRRSKSMTKYASRSYQLQLRYVAKCINRLGS